MQFSSAYYHLFVQAIVHPYVWRRDCAGLFGHRQPELPISRVDTCCLSAFVGYMLLDTWVLLPKGNLALLAHHSFTISVYGIEIVTTRALHMGRLILLNEIVTILNGLRRAGSLPILAKRKLYDATMACVYLLFRLPLHNRAAGVVVRQGYREFVSENTEAWFQQMQHRLPDKTVVNLLALSESHSSIADAP